MRDRSSGRPSRGEESVSGFRPDAGFLARVLRAAGASALAGSRAVRGRLHRGRIGRLGSVGGSRNQLDDRLNRRRRRRLDDGLRRGRGDNDGNKRLCAGLFGLGRERLDQAAQGQTGGVGGARQQRNIEQHRISSGKRLGNGAGEANDQRDETKQNNPAA